MIVKEIMSTSILCCRPDDDFATLQNTMKAEDIGIIPVCDVQKHVLGIITDRDLLLRQSDGKKAVQLMTSPVVTIDSNEDIHKAALILSKNKIRCLPVVESGKLVGMLTFKEFAKKKYLSAEIGHIIYNIYNN